MKREAINHKSKKSQAELITTVLLILIGIAAVVLVSAFVISLVKNNLQGADCFQTTGQLEIKTDSGQTFFNSTLTPKVMSISIKRGSKDFNLTGIQVVLGDGKTSKSYSISASGGSSEVKMADGTAPPTLPDRGMYQTYLINTTLTNVNTLEIVPVIYPKTTCDEGKVTTTI